MSPQIFWDKPHTLPDSSQDAQTCAMSQAFPVCYFTAPQNDPLGFTLCPLTETPWSPPKITGCGA